MKYEFYGVMVGSGARGSGFGQGCGEERGKDGEEPRLLFYCLLCFCLFGGFGGVIGFEGVMMGGMSDKDLFVLHEEVRLGYGIVA